jgi:hypothetical protein
MSRLDIDINQPEFLPVEVAILHELIDKHEQYEAQGRDLEARSMHRAVTIVFKGLKGDFHDTEPTEWGSL